MKARRILGAILLGRNTGNLASRFEYHLMTIIGLSIVSSMSGVMRHLALRDAALGETVPEFIATCASAYEGLVVATVSLIGYTGLAMVALLVLGILPWGEPDPA